jgi:CMP-N-acetylneuraminate monooxygenase
MFINKGSLKYDQESHEYSFPLSNIEDGTNFTKEFIIFKNEELIKVYSRKCDHAGGKLCKLDGKIACPLHGWEFNPISGSYVNTQLAKKEEDFFIKDDNIIIPHSKEILSLPNSKNNHEISVELLSHACLLFKTKDFSFATDPWVEGFAFSSGWWTAQYPPINWQDELNKVDFIYISHNHPDHLNQFTLEKIRKDMHFIVPKFANDSVRKLLNRFGFHNISSFDLNSYYKYKDTDLYFTILKSGDFREDSGFYFTYGNFKCLSTVDSNDLNFSRFPKDISLFCAAFAGGAQGFPLCFNTIEEDKKLQILERNIKAIKSTVKNQIKVINPNYFLPYAGYFSERAKRDGYIKNINKKNKSTDYVESLKTLDVDVLDSAKDDSFLFKGDKLIKINSIDRQDNFSEEPEIFYKRIFDKSSIDNAFIKDFFLNSNLKDDLKVYFELTNDDFSETKKYIYVDFSKDIYVNFDPFDWDSIKDLYIQNSKIRHLHIKVRKDAFSWAIKNNMPFEDLLIGFQCRIDRKPDIYNVKFWDHFTNIYI